MHERDLLSVGIDLDSFDRSRELDNELERRALERLFRADRVHINFDWDAHWASVDPREDN